MEDFEQNENVVLEKINSSAEAISDKELLLNWRACYSAFKNWSWNLARRQWYMWKYFVIWLITWAFSMIASFFDSWLSALIWMQEWTSLSLFNNIMSTILWVWLLWFSFNIAKWLAQKVDNLFHEITWDRIWKTFVWSLLFALIMLGGLLLLIIPWIIFSTRFSLFAYAIIDKWYWPVDALKYSWRITKWHFWEIVWFWLYFCLINMLWLLCLIIGILWTSAMTNMAMARYYRLLSNIYDNANWLNNNITNPDGPVIYMHDESESNIEPVDSRVNSMNWTWVNLNNNINSNGVGDWNINLQNINMDELTPIWSMERPKHSNNS